MSRVGNRPISFNSNVTIDVSDNAVKLSSSKGSMEIAIPSVIKVTIDGNIISVTRSDDSKFARSQHGLVARLIKNAAEGLDQGIKKVLEFKGTGYRAKVENGKLIMAMGYSHDIEFDIPANLETTVVKNTITVTGFDAAVVGNFAAKIREVRKPEVYKGKGIKYTTEEIRRKDGKVASGGKG